MLNSDLKKLQLSLMCGAHTLPLRQFPPPAERSPYLSGHLKRGIAALFFAPAVARQCGSLFHATHPHIVIPYARRCISL
ncbi:hypothetical protein CBM2589_B30053 [Cupriavidus taiwanensis]|uniref:Uncharacterized protein n=1 Tax=Cupriavidus taiwanensis TaxID=164546 RepID=A0A976A2G8_9BURK|nr:hypothetical protein CBM2589_B30053 [Cupriavidus taiwanensis]